MIDIDRIERADTITITTTKDDVYHFSKEDIIGINDNVIAFKIHMKNIERERFVNTNSIVCVSYDYKKGD